jgi:Holliday junction resolvasome RuvABC endonuclease subunit
MRKKVKEITRPVIEASTPIYVGLDLSLTATGFCLKAGEYHDLRTIKTNPKTAENDIERLKYIRNVLMDLIPPTVKMICVEDYFIPHNPAQVGAAVNLIGLGTVVRLALYDTGLPFHVVTPTALKQFCTGKGQVQKGMILREVFRKWNIEAHDDNSADATVLAYIAQAIHTGTCRCQYEKDVVDNIVKRDKNYNTNSQKQFTLG